MSTTDLEYDQSSYILIVDDDQTLLKFFKIHLNKFFSKVIVVKNAKEAITALEGNQIDLVISDIRMPRTDGIQLMKKVRNHNPSIPIFLISGAMLTDEQVESIDDRADGFLRKPFSVDELHDYIRRGMKYREIYGKLYEIVKDKKKHRDVIRGKLNIKELKDADKRQEVEDLLAELKKAG